MFKSEFEYTRAYIFSLNRMKTNHKSASHQDINNHIYVLYITVLKITYSHNNMQYKLYNTI
jgi:hypothetical protein